MEVKKKKAIVLTPDGQFLEHQYYGEPPEIGEEIELRLQSKWDYWGFVRIAALFVIIVIPFLALQPLFTPDIFAYVTVDINPSIELAIDKNEKVISVTPLNDEGKELITKINLKNTPLTKAIELITETAIQEKYIATDRENTVFISYSQVSQNKKITQAEEKGADPEDEANSLIKKAQLEEKVQEVVNRNQQQASVEFVQVSFELRNQAKELGLSSGKFALVLEAQDIGLEINIDSLKEKGIVHAIKEAGGNPGQLIKHLHNKSNKYIASNVQNAPSQVENIINKLEQEGNVNLPINQEELSKDITLTQEDIEKIDEIKKTTFDKLSPEDQKEFNKKLLEKFKEKTPQRIIDKLKENLPEESNNQNSQENVEKEEPEQSDEKIEDEDRENQDSYSNEEKETEVENKGDTKEEEEESESSQDNEIGGRD